MSHDQAAPAEPSYAVALAEARRTLDGQLALVDTTRTRALSLVSLGGLLGAFFGGLGAIGADQRMTAALWVAAAAFGVATLAALWLLWPRVLNSSLDPATIVKGIPTRSAPEIDKWLAKRIGKQYVDNADTVMWLQRAGMLAVAAVGVEFLALVFQLIRSR